MKSWEELRQRGKSLEGDKQPSMAVSQEVGNSGYPLLRHDKKILFQGLLLPKSDSVQHHLTVPMWLTKQTKSDQSEPRNAVMVKHTWNSEELVTHWKLSSMTFILYETWYVLQLTASVSFHFFKNSSEISHAIYICGWHISNRKHKQKIKSWHFSSNIEIFMNFTVAICL